MNNTNFYVKCLELMGFDVTQGYPMGWDIIGPNNDPRFAAPRTELIEYATQELIKREDVKERVCNFVNQKIDEWDGSEEMPPPIDYYKGEIRAFIFPVGWVLKDFAWLLDKYAIPLSITPEQLMGVEG